MRTRRRHRSVPLIVFLKIFHSAHGSTPLLLQKVFRQSREVNLNFLDLVSFDREELGAAPFAAVVSSPFITNERFIAFFEELVDLKRFDVLAIRPAPLEIGGPINVIVERTGEGEVVAQDVFYRTPIVCFVSGITPANQIGYDTMRFHRRLLRWVIRGR